MRTVIAAAAMLTVAAAGTAQAQSKQKDGFYIAPAAGVVFAEDLTSSGPGFSATLDYDTGWLLTGALGYRMGQFRVEGELGYGEVGGASLDVNGTRVDVDTDLSMLTGTVAGFYDFAIDAPVTPFIGAGLGFADGEVDAVRVAGMTLDDGGSSTEFLLFGEAGLSWQVSDTVAIVPSYRYTWVNDGGDGVDDTTIHTLRVGLRIGF